MIPVSCSLVAAEPSARVTGVTGSCDFRRDIGTAMANPLPLPDPGFRPTSYWDVADPIVAITATIRGEVRRRLVTDLLTGEAERNAAVGWQLEGLELDAELLADVAGAQDLDRLCDIHPWFRGGEHLPALLLGEVEIARIVVWKADLLVVSIRAQRDHTGRIRYRVVDEIGTRYCHYRRSSLKPLSAFELIRLIDGLRIHGWRIVSDDFVRTMRCQYVAAPESDDDVRRAARLVTVSSPFYPGLDGFYALRAVGWAESWIGQMRDQAERDWQSGVPEALVAYVLERLDER